MSAPAINHIILTVSDLDKARAFYGDLLGFEVHEVPIQQGRVMYYFPAEGGASVWLLQHDQTPPGDRFSEFRIGLDHLAFTAPSKEFLDALADKLIAADVNTKGVELFHGRWYYVAFRDPDNIQLEYWLDEPVGAA